MNVATQRLQRIDYGQRDGAVYTTAAPARVVFDTAERCDPTATFACKEADYSASTAVNWQDTPTNLICAATTKCTISQASPSFFTRKRLVGITTQVRSGTTWVPVDGWVLGHKFLNNGDGSRSDWLNTITHSGWGGTTTDPVTLPTVTLIPLQLANRVAAEDHNIGPLVRSRLQTVQTEAGAQIDVNYWPSDCTAGQLPSGNTSNKRCYAIKWSPTGKSEPSKDWFNKYVVSDVVETDRTGGNPDQVTHYDYNGPAGWRYADATGLSKDEDKYRTWSQWRGYRTVTVTEGDKQNMTTKSVHTYLRGLDGGEDPDGSGTVSEPREDSEGGKYTDSDELASFEIETAVYDGSTVITKTITHPKVITTATSRKHAWGTTDTAQFVVPADARAYSRLADGSWRQTRSVTSYDSDTGRVTTVDDLGDVATDDDKCTRNEYADNDTAHILNLVSRKETVAVTCAATPNRATQLIADERTYYDTKPLGAAPSRGDITKVETLKSHDGTNATYITDATTSEYDEYGRPKLVEDALHTQTRISYTQVNGLTTQKTETGPLGSVVTDYDPTRGASTGQTDMNGRRTDLGYDKLGRLINVWLPDRPKSGTPNTKYTYSFQANKPVYVKTETIKNDGSYRSSYQIYDGMLRPRQVQADGPDGGRLVADTLYNATGQVRQVNDLYYANGAASGQILPSRNGDVDGQTQYVYDGADRVTNAITLVAGTERWRTTTRYDGADRTSVTPAKGGTPTTSVTNGRGLTTALLQYKGDTPDGPADTSRYTYTPAGQLATVTDPARNVWEHRYDQRGREVTTIDPDTGTTTTDYDDLDRPTTTVDGNKTALTTSYDTIGRKTGLYQGRDTSGTPLASWTWDTVAKGQLYSAIRYVNGNKFEIRTPVLDALYRPREVDYVIPKAEVGDKLGGTYQFTTAYNPDGTIYGRGMPKAGSLPSEAVGYTYDDFQRIKTIFGTNTYATDMIYAHTGGLLRAELNTGGRKAWAAATYEQGTKRQLTARVARQNITVPGGPPDTTPDSDVNATYSYDDAGDVLSIADTPGTGDRDIQCFQYDYLRRMSEAWTSASTDLSKPCAGGPDTTGVGGVAPYHQSYTYDSSGNRRTQTIHAAGGTPQTGQDYRYPDPATPHPHALSSMTSSTASGDTLNTYKYDDAGNMIKRVRGGTAQDLTWDPEGHLATVTESGKTTSFLYSADGDRLIRKEPGATTLYLPGHELRLDTTSNTVATTRFYDVSDQAAVVRTTAGLQFQFSDPHGTANTAVDATTGAINHRRTDPFGNSRGEQPDPGSWYGQKGFVGGTQDTSTGLTQLGARLYDPTIGRFISTDPLIDPGDPQSMNAYAYANNNPVTASDPTGLYGDWCATLACAMATGGFNSITNGAQEAAGYQTSDGKPTGKGPRSGRDDNGGQDRRAAEAKARAEKAKQLLIEAAEALGKIVLDELGITDAFDCITKGNLGACAETVLNIVGTFVGGVVAKLARKYAAPWRWEKAAKLGRELWDLGKKIVNGIRDWMKESKVAKLLARGCNSFTPETLVLVADRTSHRIFAKKIVGIHVGDKIVATDPISQKTKISTVAATHVTEDYDFTDVTTVDAHGRRSIIHTTANHPFWNASTKNWTPAGQLQHNDELSSIGRSHVRVTVAASFAGDQIMYNLTVTDVHTYYVFAGDTPVLVHNTNCAPAMLDDMSEAYVRGKHMPGGENVTPDKSVFNKDVDLDDLVERGNSCSCQGPNASGFYERDVDAGSVIGRLSENSGGLPTTRYRVVQDKYGGVITMHPIP